MASAEDRAALLGVSCAWCGAAPGEDCHVRETSADKAKGTRRYSPVPITTLDGGCHDARWRAALSRGAEVLTAAVPSPDPVTPGDANVARVAVSVGDRPW